MIFVRIFHLLSRPSLSSPCVPRAFANEYTRELPYKFPPDFLVSSVESSPVSSLLRFTREFPCPFLRTFPCSFIRTFTHTFLLCVLKNHPCFKDTINFTLPGGRNQCTTRRMENVKERVLMTKKQRN